jgi:hypothetical protein
MKSAILWPICALIGLHLHLHELRAETWTVEAERAFAEGSRRFQDGKYDSALQQFYLAHAAGMRSAAVSYNIGVCQYRTADYAGSAETFRRISLDYPDLRFLAYYNLGLALAQQNRDEEAQRAFLEARLSDDTTVVQLADAMLQRFTNERRTPAKAWQPASLFGFAELGFGYDDNLALLDETNISAGETTDSTFGEFFGRIGGTVGAAANFRYDASAYLVHYPDADRFDQSVLRLGGDWSWWVGDWSIYAGPYFAYSTLDGDGYDQRVGLGLSVLRQLSQASQFAFFAVREGVANADSRYAFIEGSNQLLGMRYFHNSGRHRISLHYEFSIDDRASASVSPTRHSLRASYHQRFDENWTAGVEASFRSSEYGDLSEPREEDLGEIALVLFRNLSSTWQISGEYRYSENDSNIGAFAYERHRATLGLNRIF